MAIECLENSTQCCHGDQVPKQHGNHLPCVLHNPDLLDLLDLQCHLSDLKILLEQYKLGECKQASSANATKVWTQGEAFNPDNLPSSHQCVDDDLSVYDDGKAKDAHPPVHEETQDAQTSPNMKVGLDRLKTFCCFPWLTGQCPVELASAGLYSLGVGDVTGCRFCGMKLCSWRREDDPFIEHRRLSPNCPFLQGSVVGNVPLKVHEDVHDQLGPEMRSPSESQGPVMPESSTIEEEHQTNLEWFQCRICHDRRWALVYPACGHMCCEDCDSELDKCPFCRQPMKAALPIRVTSYRHLPPPPSTYLTDVEGLD